jgi:ribosomal protein L27
MAGGKSTPKKDIGVKVSGGETVKTGQILVRGFSHYKAGINTKGIGTIFALSSGKVSFGKKKTPHGKMRTFVNVIPAVKS